MKKKKVKWIIIFVILIMIVLWLILETNSLVVTKIQYTNYKIPSEFDGYRIVQISDLHDKNFGKNQSKLLAKIKECEPNIIVITGDFIDRSPNDINDDMSFLESMVAIAPVY